MIPRRHVRICPPRQSGVDECLAFLAGVAAVVIVSGSVACRPTVGDGLRTLGIPEPVDVEWTLVSPPSDWDGFLLNE
ncbi:MAG TPA: hypothetical protein VLM89_17585 [Phycisphaerae bacterium]|nr:hypothetical protein [Phycisphaerae bacterium]